MSYQVIARKWRPQRFDDVVGQQAVTRTLRNALAIGRLAQAFVFAGPRGVGKTTTARILARALNCEKGPTADPCGTCNSCIELAPNGPGSIDVIELDAASNRGIDQARELREKAVYAPAASRYKIYIIDEAHQLTTEAANALLKLVEEPPEHLRFVFATTEPDKLLGTIRSRTHHYPFRLVPAKLLIENLAMRGHIGCPPSGSSAFVGRCTTATEPCRHAARARPSDDLHRLRRVRAGNRDQERRSRRLR